EIEEISPNDEEREQQRWAEKAIGKEAWERRQQSGEYDSASISSSIVNRFKHKRTDSNRLAATAGQGALIPYNPSDPYSRRAGSDVDLTYGGMEPPMAGWISFFSI
ncbi:unnamed protein product, partial [Anisakis simplex]|uniref:PRP21_like_P domain-containing protein n=1 Tax=Anisakis simplex TaxID=6269 RepID=A0A0M3JA83_ANISI